MCVERHPAPSAVAPKASMWPSVAVRSSRLAPVKSGIAQKVAVALTETGLSTHLIMPTKTNIAKLDELQAALSQMIELKKAVDRIQGEIRLVRKKKMQLLGIEEPVIKGEDDDGDKAANRVSSLAASLSCALADDSPAEQAERVRRVVDGLDEACATRLRSLLPFRRVSLLV